MTSTQCKALIWQHLVCLLLFYCMVDEVITRRGGNLRRRSADLKGMPAEYSAENVSIPGRFTRRVSAYGKADVAGAGAVMSKGGITSGRKEWSTAAQ